MAPKIGPTQPQYLFGYTKLFVYRLIGVYRVGNKFLGLGSVTETVRINVVRLQELLKTRLMPCLLKGAFKPTPSLLRNLWIYKEATPPVEHLCMYAYVGEIRNIWEGFRAIWK